MLSNKIIKKTPNRGWQQMDSLHLARPPARRIKKDAAGSPLAPSVTRYVGVSNAPSPKAFGHRNTRLDLCAVNYSVLVGLGPLGSDR